MNLSGTNQLRRIDANCASHGGPWRVVVRIKRIRAEGPVLGGEHMGSEGRQWATHKYRRVVGLHPDERVVRLGKSIYV